MKCSVAREALSATYDGEEPAVDLAQARAHTLTCHDCEVFAQSLTVMTHRVSLPTPPIDLVGQVVRPRTPTWQVLVRIAIVACGVLELVSALLTAGAAGHAAHESAAFTTAICAGLIIAGTKPQLARPYLPIIGAAAVLNLLWAAVDVGSGTITWGHEAEHDGLLVGTLLLAVMAWSTGGRGPRRARPVSGPHLPKPPQMRLVMRVAAAFAAVAIPVVVAAPASAHAVLEDSTPVPGQVLKVAPTDVSLHFDESVTTLPTSLRVFGPDGARVDSGAVGYVGHDGSTIHVGVTTAKEGTYLVSWRVISADSHPVSGAFTYSVGKPTSAPVAATLQTDRTAEFALGSARWISYAGSALIVGGGLFFLLGGGPRSRRLVRIGGAALVVGSLALIALKGPVDAGLGLGALGQGSLIREVLGTTFGHAALWRTGFGLVALAVGVPRRIGGGLIGAIGAGIAWSFAFSGHAIHQVWPMLLDGLHVLAMTVWIGGLVAIGVDGVPGRRGTAIRRFSAIALGSVCLLVLTGVLQAWRQVGAWGALTGTAYGRDLLFKGGIVVVVIAVAYASRRLTRQESWSTLRRTVAIETVGAVAIIGFSSALSMTQPATTAWHPSVDANLVILGDTVQVSAVPAGDRTMSLHVYVFGPTGMPIDPPELDASVALPSEQIGPLPVALSVAGPGHRVATLQVPTLGTWSLKVTLRTTEIDQDSRTVDLPIR